MSDAAANKQLIERFWNTLYGGDYDGAAAYFAQDGVYQDVPTPDAGAVGPRQVAGRLRMGLEQIEGHVHKVDRMVAEGDTVVTEHTEEWHWHTGEVVALPFVSIHVIEDGRIKLWRDYWDLNTLMSGAPAWWIERLARYTADDFDKV